MSIKHIIKCILFISLSCLLSLQVLGHGSFGEPSAFSKDYFSWFAGDIIPQNRIVAIAIIDDTIFGATNDNRLLASKIEFDVEEVSFRYNEQGRWKKFIWRDVGRAENVTAMTALNGQLFATTKANRLLVRSPVLYDVSWRDIGHAFNVTSLTSYPQGGGLYAVTNSNRIFVRPPVLYEVDWKDIGHAWYITALVAIGPYLYAENFERGNYSLHRRSNVDREVAWQRFDDGVGLVAMAPYKSVIFAISQDRFGVFSLLGIEKQVRASTRRAPAPAPTTTQCYARGDQISIEVSSPSVLNGILYFRTMGAVGQCTNNLGHIEASKEVCRVPTGECLLGGVVRKKYRIVYNR